ncbi:hypothetical protein RIF29_16881 [Crotalaria pallida]|uniref:VQ domain-containing protein n=1 Tax=Crotalaria pallida TaxID=3830 RepID=A0AAN9FGB2_CROPI
MDSGNSGSISSSGDEEYDSRVDHHTLLLPSTFLNHPPTQFVQSSPLVSSHHHQQTHHNNNNNPSLFDLSSSYLHSLSQSQPNTNPNPFLNLDTTTTSTSQARRSEPNCTDPATFNQCLFPPPHGLGNDENNARVVPAPTNNNNNAVAARNSKKRTRASRRAPTTVLTTDTSNFRAMVQEFTGIPAPPFSGNSSSYTRARRLDLLIGGSSSSSLRSSTSHLMDTTPSFYPLRPSPQKLLHHHQNQQNPLASSTLMLHNSNMVDAIGSSSTTNNNNYQLLPPELGLPYQPHHHSQNNIMLSMQQNHPSVLPFHPSPLGNHVLSSGFGAKSHQASLSVQSLEELGVNHGQVNNNNAVDLVGSSSGDGNGERRDVFIRSLDEGYGNKVAASASASASAALSRSLNREKTTTLENNNGTSTSTRGEGNVDSWICSSD